MSRFLALLLSLAMLGGRADGRSQQDASTPDSLSVREYFRDTLSLVDKAGVRRAIEVSLTQWSLTGGLDVARFPQRGLLVVQLGGGDVTTIIGKRRQDRRVGEFWTVAPDSGMGVKTKDDQVILDVFAVSEEPSRRRTRE